LVWFILVLNVIKSFLHYIHEFCICPIGYCVPFRGSMWDKGMGSNLAHAAFFVLFSAAFFSL
jgi:hypothetical protein